MGKKAPNPPDMTAAAEKQGQASKEITNMQTWANRPDINTPWGNQSWTPTHVRDPATGQDVTKWVQNNTLNPQEQAAKDAQDRITSGKSGIAEGLMKRAGGELNKPIDYNSAIKLQGMSGDPGAFYNKAGDTIMNQFKRYQEPQMAQQLDAKKAELVAQGLQPGDQAYDSAMTGLQNQQSMSRQNAMDEATKQSWQVGNQTFQNQMQQTGFNNTTHQGQIADMLQQQGFSLNEINSILNGQQINMPTMPNFSQASKSETPQYLQAANDQFSADSKAASMSNENAQSMMKGATGAAMMFSDRRLKVDITFLGLIRGLKIYCWNYIWGEAGAGVLADEVDPRFVVRHESGYDMVNYGALNA